MTLTEDTMYAIDNTDFSSIALKAQDSIVDYLLLFLALRKLHKLFPSQTQTANTHSNKYIQ